MLSQVHGTSTRRHSSLLSNKACGDSQNLWNAVAHSEYIKQLQARIAEVLGCDAIWIRTEHIHEEMDGKTVWDGSVEVFALIDHPRVRWTYCWNQSDEPDEEKRIVLIPEFPPITCAHDAVRGFISEGGDKSRHA